MTTKKPLPPRQTTRCAIYTRKSTEEGLQQDFNTLDAQCESAEAYIAAQKHEGWVCLPDRYDDGGFTGGNLDRPAVQRMMNDIKAGKIDCVVVYKVARALANRPSLILADEPTAALDSVRGRQVMELFRKVAHEQNAGVIVVTHDHRALDVFDRALEMEDGKLRESIHT